MFWYGMGAIMRAFKTGRRRIKRRRKNSASFPFTSQL
jgi:hypothetical protein